MNYHRALYSLLLHPRSSCSTLNGPVSPCYRFCTTAATVADKKPRKRRRKTREAADQVTETDRPPRSSYSFYGKGAMENEGSHGNDSTNQLDKFLGKVDTPTGERYYVYQDGPQGAEFRLPSVTTVLQDTRPPSSWFSLRNWRKSMVKEHGEEGYEKWRQRVIRDGVKFHSLLEKKLKSSGSNKFRQTQHKSKTYSKATPSDPLSPPVPLMKTPNPLTTTLPQTSLNSSLIDKFLFPLTAAEDDDTEDLICALDTCCNSLSPSLTSSPLPSSFNESLYTKYRYSESVKNILSDLSDVMVTEGVVIHQDLGYCGTVDCVAKYRGNNCLIDWKTSRKPKPSLDDLYDYPLQTAAYAGAINSDISYPFKVDNILIVVAYPTGSLAHAHFLDSTQCLDYWEKWLDRLEQYQTQFAHDLSTVIV